MIKKGINDRMVGAVKSRMDIYEVISDFVDLKKKGANYFGFSPFVDEKTPSLSVSPGKQIFKCFSSGISGDAISFLMEKERYTFPEAIEWLAKKYSIPMADAKPATIKKEKKKKEVYEALAFAKDFYEKNLYHSDEGKSVCIPYLKARWLTGEVARQYGLGYATDQVQGLIHAFEESGRPAKDLELAGLLMPNKSPILDMFRRRLMFPIQDASGKVIGFGGRLLKGKKAKYINSPETEFYPKRRVLYGIYQAKDAIRKQDNCYLVEGYTDVLSLSQSGIQNVVASCGTAVTADHILLIKKYSQNITVLMDGDSAGTACAMGVIDTALSNGLSVHVVKLPAGKDPDSHSNDFEAGAFKSYLEENAQNFIDFQAGVLLSDGNAEAEDKVKAVQTSCESVSKISNPLTRTVYIERIAKDFGIDPGLAEQEIAVFLPKEKARPKKKKSKPDNEESFPYNSLVEAVLDWILKKRNLRKNLLSLKLELEGKEMDEEDINSIYLDASMDINPKIPKEVRGLVTMRDINAVLNSRNIPSYHPILEWVEAHRHLPHKPEILDDLCNCMNLRQPDSKVFLRRWLLGIPYRIKSDGVAVCLMLCLTGEKDAGKTTFLDYLFPDEFKKYCVRSTLQKKQDNVMTLATNFLVINDDMVADTHIKNTMKMLLSAKTVNMRLPYAKLPVNLRLVSAIASTSNEQEVLDDITENRRILPLHFVSRYDTESYNNIDKDQVFMEVWRAYERGESWKLNESDNALLHVINSDHKVMNFEMDMIYKHFVSKEEAKEDESYYFQTSGEIKDYLNARIAKGSILNERKLGQMFRVFFERSAFRCGVGVRKGYYVVFRDNTFSSALIDRLRTAVVQKDNPIINGKQVCLDVQPKYEKPPESPPDSVAPF